ncbi:MAG: ribosome-binding factor A [Bacteroidia bacterium]|nr:MAG: ribosome-binding factor A [Bacteroidia bacterium]PIE86221.1 MAG: ribosome-binding factor A [Bacteroidia bacterium]
MASIRQNKVARLIQKELSDYFQKDPHSLYHGRMVSVTLVRLSPDLGIAKTYLSIFPSDKSEEILAKIEENKKKIRNDLGQRVGKQLRLVPELHFYIDDSLDYIENIEKLLKK